MIEAPFEAAGVPIANAVEDAVFFFLYALAKPIGSENRDQSKSDEQRAYEREGHGVRHGMKEFSSRSAERVDRQVAGDDDRDGLKDGTVNITGGV